MLKLLKKAFVVAAKYECLTENLPKESGVVALAAPADASSAPGVNGGSELLAVIQIQSHAVAEVRLGSPDGPLLQFESLPYALPDAA